MNQVKLSVRVVLLALLVSVWGCEHEARKDHPAHAHADTATYTCPMHPEIVRSEAGSCPVCGMDLVKKETGTKEVDHVALETLLRPVNAFVLSAVPVTALEKREEALEFPVVGTVAYDARQSRSLSSRIGGRIERLYVRYRFQPVKKGQRILDIYSPELVTAQQNLLFLLRHDAGNKQLVDAARERLALIGMTRGQVRELERTGQSRYSVAIYSPYDGFVTEAGAAPGTAGVVNGGAMQASASMQSGATNVGSPVELQLREGSYVQPGQALFLVYNSNKAWILLEVFPEQQQAISKGNPVRIVPETAPQSNFRATIDYIEPVFRPGSKTLTARVYFNNAKFKLPIGSRVTANVFSKSQTALWLPKETLFSLGRERIVFLREDKGFRAQQVTTGMEVNGYVQVEGGLTLSDSVAANAQYLVDNEAFIKVKQP